MTELEYAAQIWQGGVVLLVIHHKDGHRRVQAAYTGDVEEKAKHLQRVFGGTVFPYRRREQYKIDWKAPLDNQIDPETDAVRGYRNSARVGWTWRLGGLRAIKAAIAQVFPHLSPKYRGKAEEFLARVADIRDHRGHGPCPNEDWYYSPGGRRECREWMRQGKRRRKAAKRKELQNA